MNMRLKAMLAEQGRPRRRRIGVVHTIRTALAGLVGMAMLGATWANDMPIAETSSVAAPTNLNHVCGYVITPREVLYLYRPPSFSEQVKVRMAEFKARLTGQPPAAPAKAGESAPESRSKLIYSQQQMVGLALLALAAAASLAQRIYRRRKAPTATTRFPATLVALRKRFTRKTPEQIPAPPTIPAVQPTVPLPVHSDLKGSLSAIPMGAVLQMLGAECATGVLQVEEKDGGPLGQLVLVDGRVRDAQARKQRGKDAVFELVGHRKGEFHFRIEKAPVSQETIQEDMVSLLLEAHRRIDEAEAGCPQNRRPFAPRAPHSPAFAWDDYRRH